MASLTSVKLWRKIYILSGGKAPAVNSQRHRQFDRDEHYYLEFSKQKQEIKHLGTLSPPLINIIDSWNSWIAKYNGAKFFNQRLNLSLFTFYSKQKNNEMSLINFPANRFLDTKEGKRTVLYYRPT